MLPLLPGLRESSDILRDLRKVTGGSGCKPERGGLRCLEPKNKATEKKKRKEGFGALEGKEGRDGGSAFSAVSNAGGP